MKSKLASNYFHGKDGYNCAQAVLKAFQHEANLTPLIITEARALGGGRAENGICGAIHSALRVSGDAKGTEELLDKFKAKTGSIFCADIKESEEGCRQHVKLAAQLAAQHIDNTQSK